MAGHSQFKNIMHRKGAQDAKRSKNFGKLIREITVAVKSGAPDINFNPRLRTAISAARAANLPKDKIDNAINKASSTHDDQNFDEVRYEAYTPGGTALIIDALTDNRNRTSSDVKALINKNGGNMAEPGSVIYMFDRVGLIEFHNSKISEEAMLEIAIEAGADECISENGNHEIYCDPNMLNEVNEFVTGKAGEPNITKLHWKPKNTVEVQDIERAEKLLKLIDALEDHDDIQSVCGNYEISDSIADKIKI